MIVPFYIIYIHRLYIHSICLSSQRKAAFIPHARVWVFRRKFITKKNSATGKKTTYKAYRVSESLKAGAFAAEWTVGSGGLAFAKPKKDDIRFIRYPQTAASVSVQKPEIAKFSENAADDAAVKNAIRREIGFKTRKNPVFLHNENGISVSSPVAYITVEEEFGKFLLFGIYTADGFYFRAHDTFLLAMQEGISLTPEKAAEERTA